MFVVLLSLLVLLTACKPAPKPVEPTEDEVMIVSSIMGASMEHAFQKQGIEEYFGGSGNLTEAQIEELFEKLADVNVTVEGTVTMSEAILNSGSIKMKCKLVGDSSAVEDAKMNATININVNATVSGETYDFYMSGTTEAPLQEVMMDGMTSIPTGFTVKLGDKYLDMTNINLE